MLQREIDNRAIIDAFSILSTKVQAEIYLDMEIQIKLLRQLLYQS